MIFIMQLPVDLLFLWELPDPEKDLPNVFFLTLPDRFIFLLKSRHHDRH